MEICKSDMDILRSVSLAKKTKVGLDDGQTIVPHYSESTSGKKSTGGDQMLRFVNNEDYPFGFSYVYNEDNDKGIETNLYYNTERVVDELAQHMSFDREGRINTDAKDIIYNNNFITGAKLELGNDHFIPLPYKLDDLKDLMDDPMEDIFREMTDDNGVSVYIQQVFYPIDYGVWTNRSYINPLEDGLKPSKLQNEYEKRIQMIEQKLESGSNIPSVSGNIKKQAVEGATDVVMDQAKKQRNNKYPIRLCGGYKGNLLEIFKDTAERIKTDVIRERKMHYATEIRLLFGADDKESIKRSVGNIQTDYEKIWSGKNDYCPQQFVNFKPCKSRNTIEQVAVNCRQKRTAIDLYGQLRNPYISKLFNLSRSKPMIIHPNTVSQFAHIPSELLNIDIERAVDTGDTGVDEEERFTDF